MTDEVFDEAYWSDFEDQARRDFDTAPAATWKTRRDAVRQPRQPDDRPTGNKVWRGSVFAGGETRTPLSWADRARRLQAVEKLARESREKGRRRGHRGNVGRAAMQMFDYLTKLAVQCRGAVFPDYEQIAEGAGISKSHVRRCGDELERQGLIRIVRRKVKVSGVDARGRPAVKQTSNWYEILEPNKLKALLTEWLARKRTAKPSSHHEGRPYADAPYEDPQIDAAIDRGRQRAEARNSAARRSGPS